MTDAEAEEWQRHLAAAVEKTLAARAARKAEREEFKTRRDFGKARYHREKLARNRQEDAVPEPPCCSALGEVCPQHQQAAREIRHQGPRNRSGRPQVVVGESGKARPVRDTEENR